MAAGLELIRRAEAAADRLAVVDPGGEFSYARLLEDSAAVARGLLGDEEDLGERPVAFLCQPGYDYVTTQ
jgi:non-ribosomal peptide synthetase component E (peptide arylation enzyme)